MKRFYTIILMCLAVAGVVPAMADETEVTARYLKNPSFESQFANWTQESMQTQTNTSFTLKAGTTYVEKWVNKGSKVGSCEVFQTLSKLPAGTYRLQVAAQNIQQDEATAAQTGAYIYAGAERTTVTVGAQYSVEFTTIGESVDVGFKAVSASGNWLCVDNFRLFYVGADVDALLVKVAELIATAEQTLATADKTSPALLQTSFRTALTDAIAEAKALDSNTSVETLGEVSVRLYEANEAAAANYQAMLALKTLVNRAQTYLLDSRKMAAVYKQALQAAYEPATAILSLESDADIAAVTEALQTAYDNSVASNTAYNTLNRNITTASSLNRNNKEGVEELDAAIEVARTVLEKDDATPEEMNEASAALERAILLFRVTNGTGTQPTAKTGTVVAGSTIVFARATFSGGTVKEKGFCYSTEEQEPTIFDSRSTASISNNGDIYTLLDLEPGTVYYVRPYIISATYKVGYGDAVKTATLPKANITWSYDYAGDNATNTRIVNAINQAVETWTACTSIRDFNLSVHYVPGAGAGSGTADCSYGGYMRISQSTAYQATGTVMHEGAHGLGVGTHWHWYNNATYRANTSSGRWLGQRVDRVVQFLQNDATAWLNGDGTHMWPYGINGAQEDTHEQKLYYANALILEALNEDNLPSPNHDFAVPAYTFTQDDDTKYYIKSADEARGLKTSYLREGKTNFIKWEAMTSDEAFQNDSCAWYITYTPGTAYYTLRNAATGKVMNYVSTATNGIRMATNATTTSRFQLMPARAQTTVGDFTFATLSYWLVAPSSLASLTAVANGNTSAAAFNHADSSTTQRWLLLTADEVARFGEANGETVGIQPFEGTVQASVQVRGGAGMIGITAVGGGADVLVYSVDGRLLRQLYVQQDANAVVRLPRGVYVVNGEKVMVR